MIKYKILQKKFFELFISTIIIFLSFFYAFNFPIDFHCDSATFYNNGSAISQEFFKVGIGLIIFFFVIFFIVCKYFKSSHYLKKFAYIVPIFLSIYIFLSLNSVNTPFTGFDFNRPPNYPFFLFLSGLYFFDSFKLFIFFQSLLSIFSIYLFYCIILCLTENKKYSLISSLIFGLTSIPYILITFVSAEHLLYFFIILTIFSIVKFKSTQKIIYIYIGAFSSLICWLTKWEGQLIFIAFISFVILNIFISKSKKRILQHCLFISIGISFLLLSWTSIRSFKTNNFSTIFQISETSMNQFIWRFYSSLPSRITIYEEKFNLIQGSSGKFVSDIYPNQATGTLLINKENGPHSTKLFNLIFKSLEDMPNAFMKLKKPLDESYRDKHQKEKNINYYNELFGKFDNSLEITENIFNQPNIFYFNFFNQQLDFYLNKKEKSDLYFYVILESLKKYPVILVTTFFDFFYAYGINFRDYFINNKNLYASVDDNDFVMPYNAGMCAENNLTKSQFNEYKISHKNFINKKDFTLFIEEKTDFLNDFIINYFGIFILLSYFFLLFKDFSLFFPLIFIPLSLVFTISLLVDYPANSKYELLYFPINLVVFLYSIFLILSKIRVSINAK